MRRVHPTLSAALFAGALAASPAASDADLIVCAQDGTANVLAIEGKNVRLADQVKVGDKRLSGIAITHDGRNAIVVCATRTAPRCSRSTAAKSR